MNTIIDFCRDYQARLHTALSRIEPESLANLFELLSSLKNEGRKIFICGNGGSAGNASHITNDLMLGLSHDKQSGFKIFCLSDCVPVVSCLANDLGYDRIYANQLKILAEPGDCLVVLSGSGNSPNILSALNAAKAMGVIRAGIFGFDGGEALSLCDFGVHVPVEDMQMSEDSQLIIFHMAMQWFKGR